MSQLACFYPYWIIYLKKIQFSYANIKRIK
ncbi:hypothetical protein ACIFOT_24700 [Neobacillus sp. NRS-1170]